MVEKWRLELGFVDTRYRTSVSPGHDSSGNLIVDTTGRKGSAAWALMSQIEAASAICAQHFGRPEERRTVWSG